MKNKGFVWLPVLLGMLLVAVLGGAYVYVTQKPTMPTEPIYIPDNTTTKTTQTTATTKVNLGGGYLKDSNYIYFDVANPQVIQGADVGTFVLVDKNYIAKDKNHVYSLGKVLVGADPKTFVDADAGTYWKDSSHVWILPDMGKGDLVELPDADANTFVYLGNGSAKDVHHTYGMDAKGYPTIDGMSTHLIPN